MSKHLLPTKDHSNQVRVAHISDLHFFDPSIGIKDLLHMTMIQFASHIHPMINKRRRFSEKDLQDLTVSLSNINPDVLIISGDLTSSGLHSEIQLFNKWINTLSIQSIITVPGNHDSFSFKETSSPFYELINVHKPDQKQKISQVEIGNKDNKWSVICMDQSINPSHTSLINRFRPCGTVHSQEYLNQLINEGSNKKIVVGHFPLISPITGRGITGFKALKNSIIKSETCHIYAHGDLHCFSVNKLDNKTISVDAGSCLIGRNDPSFAVFDLYDEKIIVHQLCKGFSWKCTSSFLLKI